MPSRQDRFSYCEYYTGREEARRAVIKQIYTKYYRRKFADGNFRASWIPDPEKLKRLYVEANKRAIDDTNKCQLITLNPGCGDEAANPCVLEEFLICVLELMRQRKNLMSPGAEFCIEHRGTESQLAGIHVHLWHDNVHGIAKSEIIRRFIMGFEQVGKRHQFTGVRWTKQSVDVRDRPKSSCQSYIRKNKASDTKWGYGFQGYLHGDLDALREKLDCQHGLQLELLAERQREMDEQRRRHISVLTAPRHPQLRRIDLEDAYEEVLPKEAEEESDCEIPCTEGYSIE